LNHNSSDSTAIGWRNEGPWFEHRDETENCLVWKMTRCELSKRTCDDFLKKPKSICSCAYFRVPPQDSTGGLPNLIADQTTHWTTDGLSTSCPHTKMLCIYPMFPRATLQQWKWKQLNEHWTTRAHKALPAKGIHENLKVCFPNISVPQVEFNWYQTSVSWNISILHYRGRNHPKSRVQVHPEGINIFRSVAEKHIK